MSDKPIHLVATFTVKDGKINELLEALKLLTETVQQAEPGVLRYFAFQTKNSKGQDQLVMVEKYASKDAQKIHGDTAHFKSFVGHVQGFLAGPLDIKAGPYVAGYESKL